MEAIIKLASKDKINNMSDSRPPIDVVHNEERKRFQVKKDGYIAETEYILTKTRIIFTHTEVPKALENQGIGGTLARTGLDYARAKGLSVMPLCPFIASYMRKHPEYLDLLAAGVNL